MERVDHRGSRPQNGQMMGATYDKLMRAWDNSMELTRDFEVYAKQIHDNVDVAQMFREFAEDEGHHAARLREVLHQYQE